jgi:hypothetical protein
LFGTVSAAIVGVIASSGCGDAGEPQPNTEVVDRTTQALIPGRTPELRFLGRYVGEGGFDNETAAIVAYEPRSAQLYGTNIGQQRIDVIDISDPTAPVLSNTIDITPCGSRVASVAVSPGGIVAAAVGATDPQAPGTLALFDAEGTPLAAVEVGAVPDMVTFTPNGRYALVANEGEPSDDYSVDPEGTVSIVRIPRNPSRLSQEDVATADFTAFNDQPLDPSIRIFGPGATVAQDLEPEYITVADNSRTAWVTLQENNAVAVIDIRRAQVTDLFGLGYKDHSLQGSALDASDKDDIINIANYPVQGMYLPDSIDNFRSFGRRYLITANEGDSRGYDTFDEEARIGELTLDPTVFPDAEELQDKTALGRLQCTTAQGDIDGDGDFDELYSFGARSFTIWDTRGRLVFDSGDQLEQITAAAYPDEFNSTDDENGSFDDRSDAKGPEPEGVVVGRHRGHSYAFIGLERIGGIVAFDVTFAWAPKFVQYINTRDFTGDPEAGTAGDLATEGLLFIPARRSPTGKALLVAAFEVSGTTSVFEFD